MQAPTERHLLRRQKYYAFILQDILYPLEQARTRRCLSRNLQRLALVALHYPIIASLA